ncbi:hypothetical protein V8E36_002454 [Tilletia maclaganii]
MPLQLITPGFAAATAPPRNPLTTEHDIDTSPWCAALSSSAPPELVCKTTLVNTLCESEVVGHKSSDTPETAHIEEGIRTKLRAHRKSGKSKRLERARAGDNADGRDDEGEALGDEGDSGSSEDEDAEDDSRDGQFDDGDDYDMEELRFY